MTESDERRTQSVVFGVIAACIFYAGSLALQRLVPAVKNALAIGLGPGVHPTYYLRVALSLLAGALVVLAAGFVTHRTMSERMLAWTTGILIGAAAAVVVAFP